MPALNTTTNSRLDELQAEPELLRTLRGEEFEQLVADLLTQFGWTITGHESPEDDYDLRGEVLVKPDLRVTCLIECKTGSAPRIIGVDELRRLYGAKQIVGASNALFVTTLQFSQGAKDFAASKPDLQLCDFTGLVEWLKEMKPIPRKRGA